jgi:hypothetical protein
LNALNDDLLAGFQPRFYNNIHAEAAVGLNFRDSASNDGLRVGP